jgi:hypothetical protein
MGGQGVGHARILLKRGKEEEKLRSGGYVWASVLVFSHSGHSLDMGNHRESGGKRPQMGKTSLACVTRSYMEQSVYCAFCKSCYPHDIDDMILIPWYQMYII